MTILDFVHSEPDLKIRITQYCNGLLLCMDSSGVGDPKYYVFNLTTKEYVTVAVNRVLELGNVEAPVFVNLAFDPRISSHYKLICLYYSQTYLPPGPCYFDFGIYSSETGVLRQINGCLCQFGRHHHSALYWNGPVNWFGDSDEGLYFNVDEERVGTVLMSPVTYDDGEERTPRRIRYYGESNDHLHLIQTTNALATKFDVYELEKDYSGWSVKFRADLQQVLHSYPDYIDYDELQMRNDDYLFGVLGVVRKDDDEKSFLVLSIPAK